MDIVDLLIIHVMGYVSIHVMGAKIKDDDFLRGEAIIWINWEKNYQLFHQDDLDISMVGLWVL